MLSSWLTALPSIAAALAAVLVPGAVIRIAGWRIADVAPWLLVPAISMSVLGIASNVAHLVRLPWSPLPVLIVTAVIAVVAYLVRRRVAVERSPRIGPASLAGMLAALVVSTTIIATQVAIAFGRPDAISQTLDAIVHLNAIRLATDTADASAAQIGATSGIPFYPNGWHSVVTLAQLSTHAPIPVAVNSANIVIAAVVWPASCAALSWAIFRRPFAASLAALLSTGFGAFPLLLLDFGVLYPNFAGYAMVGAALAAAWLLVRSESRVSGLRTFLLLMLIWVGVGIAHPNALLAVYAMGAPMVLALQNPFGPHKRTRSRVVAFTAIALGLLAIGVTIWTVARTNFDMSRWGPWQTASQAVGEAVTLAPRQFPMTVVLAILFTVGAFVVVRQPRRIALAVPFLAALVLFVLASGFSSSNLVREMLTNPWYNDPYRLAALLPVAAIPVVTLGGLTVSHGIRTVLERLPRASKSAPGVSMLVVAIVAATVGVGPNIQSTIIQTRSQYALSPNANVLSDDELDLLRRLGDTTPPNAVILENPLTGASLAYAISDRAVTERHVFGSRSPAEEYLTKHLNDIDSDPRVCQAVEAVGADYVLDFGSQTVNGNNGDAYSGLVGLKPSTRLVLVDSQGPNAKLFRIEGC